MSLCWLGSSTCTVMTSSQIPRKIYDSIKPGNWNLHHSQWTSKYHLLQEHLLPTSKSYHPDQVWLIKVSNMAYASASKKWDLNRKCSPSQTNNVASPKHTQLICLFLSPDVLSQLGNFCGERRLITHTISCNSKPCFSTTQTHLSSVKNPYDIPLYWLVYRDPYNGLL